MEVKALLSGVIIHIALKTEVCCENCTIVLFNSFLSLWFSILLFENEHANAFRKIPPISKHLENKHTNFLPPSPPEKQTH